MESVNEVLASADTNSREYSDALEVMGELQHRLEDLQESKLRSRVETVLQGLGFKMSDMQRPCSEFSGGWQMRIALAKILLRSPSLIMLDEPTNHLDIESVAWLESYLQNYSGAVIIVSHDKAFLDALTSRTFHVSKGRLDVYAGNFDFYLTESAKRLEILQKAAANQQRAIAKTERFIERFRSKNTKAAQVQSRIKALDKIERIEVEDDYDGEINFTFPEVKRSGQVVLDICNVSKSFGTNKVLDNISFKVERGERVALVGVNGAGKSTLAKIISGELLADDGKALLGSNVEMSFFAQHQSDRLDKNNDVLTEASADISFERKTKVRGLLGSFLFSGDDVFKSVGVLSGGEKNRLALAKMLLKDFNFLLLDEPTNHLDINSKKVLQNALASFGGTYLIVSHDRDFLDPIVDRVIELSQNGVRFFEGNLSDYVERIKAEGKIVCASKPQVKVSDYKLRRKQQSMERQELSRKKKQVALIEEKISLIEEDLSKIEVEMASPDFFKKGVQCASTTENYNFLKNELQQLYSQWELLSSELEQ
ncbi:MAG: ABC-F family ATP-binding cassette domain-containing protein [Opitutales bacterium]|nr:ABC-F family ATP-binding cassette domain-containing protein [Opitutales bacterium]